MPFSSSLDNVKVSGGRSLLCDARRWYCGAVVIAAASLQIASNRFNDPPFAPYWFQPYGNYIPR